ncbi:TFIIH basal transcription factor complex helicase subunit [Rhizodiscina lignyota]|uniref:ATP-dependent DNA helicase CHL1 n=1 Tax=Rhizodiscina lignyota TaxID=1504668 RepID=A0A9P4M9G5_9PEZI|nr:TFIIH basal transcription factor complex helicase subunit [Rhizodiscina lignyota]
MDFHHPYQPYDIQRDFMTALYQCLEDGKVGIFESPTGTGKSLSLICGSLTWLRDRKRKMFDESIAQEPGDDDEPDWMVEHNRKEKRREVLQRREDLEKRLVKVRAKEEREKLKLRLQDGKPPAKRMRHSTDADEEAQFALDDYDSDDDSRSRSRKTDMNDLNLSAETLALMQKLGMLPRNRVEEDELDDEDELKIFYCSRTHSQLTQFANELRKVKLPPAIPPEAPDESTGGAITNVEVTEALKHLTLGSRKNLCINPKVLRLGNATAMNERCLELQEQKTSQEHRCPFLPNAETKPIANDFRDHALAKIRDIEELGALGKKLEICPYYASRDAIKPSEIVTLPYPLLLQKSAREALGISLKNHIVIIDEAHNLMDAITSMYSVTMSLSQLQLARSQVMMYLQKFRNRLKGKNRVYVAQTVRLMDSIISYLSPLVSAPKAAEGLAKVTDLLAGNGVDQINLYKLSRYLQESKLARKIDGYIVHTEKQKRPPEKGTTTAKTIPTLMHIQGFLLALMNPSDEGRFFYSTAPKEQNVELRYMLLDPTHHFREIVEEARAVVLAGGTMSPMNDYTQHLFPYLDNSSIMTLSCGHVIPRVNLLACPVTTTESGADFDFTFEKRMSHSMINDLGHALHTFVQTVPDGVVIFFPSYAYLDHCVKLWQTKPNASMKSLWELLGSAKPIFREAQSPSSSTDHQQSHDISKAQSADSILAAYSNAIATGNGRGALLLAVINGTLSEGINFSDSLGRGVAVVGLPFPNPHSAEWKSKMEFVSQKAQDAAAVELGIAKAKDKGKEAAREFYTNVCMRAVNQAVGRAIRHRGDYAVILLLDRRYGTSAIRGKLPGWIRGSLKTGMGVREAAGEIGGFFQDKAKSG